MKAAQPEVLAATRVNPGETLRQARENNGWTLAEVALKLNLTASSLSNLETGAFDKLPGHTLPVATSAPMPNCWAWTRQP